MDFREVLDRRRMVRAFSSEPIDAEILDRLLTDALRAPSAGNSQGTEVVVLVGPEETARYWDAALPSEWREGFAWPDLLAAPVLVVVLADRRRYLDRYAEPDKAASGLGSDAAAWSTPYWLVDGGMAVHTLLLGAVDAGLGALLFGLFAQESAVRADLGIPEDRDVIGVVALGHPRPSLPGRSATRPRRAEAEVIHRGRW
ncbi:MAG TPA: nitroreductase family protein [Acidimicrobiales bacterium]